MIWENVNYPESLFQRFSHFSGMAHSLVKCVCLWTIRLVCVLALLHSLLSQHVTLHHRHHCCCCCCCRQPILVLFRMLSSKQINTRWNIGCAAFDQVLWVTAEAVNRQLHTRVFFRLMLWQVSLTDACVVSSQGFITLKWAVNANLMRRLIHHSRSLGAFGSFTVDWKIFLGQMFGWRCFIFKHQE